MVEAQKLSAHTLVDLASRTSGTTACYDLNNVPSAGEHFLNSGKHTNESSKACVLCITRKKVINVIMKTYVVHRLQR